MAKLTFEQLAYYNRLAGFKGDALATITAIQYKESIGGQTDVINNTAFPDRPNYHAPGVGDAREYSVGISQINALAHFAKSGLTSFDEYVEKLKDPSFNAREAYRVSSGGTYFVPWSVFTNKSYLDVIDKAKSAAGKILSIGDEIFKKRGEFFGIPVPFPTGPTIPGTPDIDIQDLPNPLSWTDTIVNIGKAILDPKTWWRLLFIVAGAGMILVGLAWLNKSTIGGVVKEAIPG